MLCKNLFCKVADLDHWSKTLKSTHEIKNILSNGVVQLPATLLNNENRFRFLRKYLTSTPEKLVCRTPFRSCLWKNWFICAENLTQGKSKMTMLKEEKTIFYSKNYCKHLKCLTLWFKIHKMCTNALARIIQSRRGFPKKIIWCIKVTSRWHWQTISMHEGLTVNNL